MQSNVYPLMSRTIAPFLVLSFISNLAVLISPLFMMQVLDRVIPSGNMATLALIGGLALMALALQALVEAARDLSLGRLARWSEREGTALALAPNAKDQNSTIKQVAELSQFLTGPGVTAALGLPWIPMFLCVLFFLHPAFLILLVVLTGLFAISSRTTSLMGRTTRTNADHCAILETLTLQNASKAETRLGVYQIAQNLRQRFAEFQRLRHRHIDQGEFLSVFRSGSATLLRNAGQISALGVGAWLVTLDHLSAGGMIAGSIITSKAYGAVESSLIHWPVICAAKDNFKTLARLAPSENAQMETLADPTGALRVDTLVYPRGGGAPPRLDRVSFALSPGECLAIVGNSGSGKSTLLRALSGVAPAPIGSVFFDENELRNLSKRSLFDVAGYLPQRAELNVGTIAENISCFEQNPDPEQIVEAAKTAGVYGLIGALPNGFETNLEDQPYLLSSGQAQRLALARAIYSKPKYLFLDEPNALIDADGERALGQTLLRLKTQGTTIVMVLHRSGIMGLADKVMQLENGRVMDFGQRADVLHRLGIGGRQIEVPILPSSLQDLQDWVGSYFTRSTDQEFCQKAKLASAELFRIACLHCPADTLRFAKFFFKFINETQCEVSMIEPAETTVEQSLSVVETHLKKPNSTPEDFSPEETLLAKISALSASFEIVSKNEATHFKARLVLAESNPRLESKAV